MSFLRGGVVSGCAVAAIGFVAFVAGMVVMAVFVASRAKPVELWEIGPELRQDVDRDFADYKAGNVIYTVVLPVLDTEIKARIVKEYRNAHYGFVPMSELGSMPTHFWYYQSGEFGLWKYNDDFLFIIIRERWAHDLERRPNESKFSRALREGTK